MTKMNILLKKFDDFHSAFCDTFFGWIVVISSSRFNNLLQLHLHSLDHSYLNLTESNVPLARDQPAVGAVWPDG